MFRDGKKFENKFLDDELAYCKDTIEFYKAYMAEPSKSDFCREMYDLYNDQYNKLMQIKQERTK